ncbi:MAG TPA: type 1 glutamine amidotransferase domain-containing protein [Actinomycetota bacterium]|jgi:protease I|nr:type 1 glutamine amidotransferase domain-containing protein [Actinomycetota bacterium]
MAKVAFIMDEMFEDSEFRVPYDRVREAGHEAIIVGLEKGKKLTGKKENETVTTDVAIGDVSANRFDALVIPGGYSPDKIRVNHDMVSLTRTMVERDKPVAAVCHAGWMLAEAGVLKGKTVTSWPSIKTDLKNAGAEWVDQEVVEDGNLITSRKPDDLEAFSKTLLSQIAQRS